MQPSSSDHAIVCACKQSSSLGLDWWTGVLELRPSTTNDSLGSPGQLAHQLQHFWAQLAVSNQIYTVLRSSRTGSRQRGTSQCKILPPQPQRSLHSPEHTPLLPSTPGSSTSGWSLAHQRSQLLSAGAASHSWQQQWQRAALQAAFWAIFRQLSMLIVQVLPWAQQLPALKWQRRQAQWRQLRSAAPCLGALAGSWNRAHAPGLEARCWAGCAMCLAGPMASIRARV